MKPGDMVRVKSDFCPTILRNEDGFNADDDVREEDLMVVLETNIVWVKGGRPMAKVAFPSGKIGYVKQEHIHEAW